MNKQIRIKSKDGKEYTLEYDRTSITAMERMGFSLDKVGGQPMTIYPIIFQGAFIKNHRMLNSKEIQEMFDEIKDRNKLMNALVEMIVESYQDLASDNNEGNVTWEMS